MQGQITKLRPDIGYGVIAAENGHKYRFAASQLVNSREAGVGQSVDFLVGAARDPREIIVLAGSPWTTFTGGNA